MFRVGRRNAITYSQNFLKSFELVRRLVKSASITPSDVVVEVGAGKGIITRALAETSGKVVAFEIDQSLFSYLKDFFSASPNVSLRDEDFLKYKLQNYPYKIFSSIPFYLTSRVIRKILFSENPPVDAHLILQREAAIKLLGYPRETQLSLLLKPVYEISIKYQFERSDFTPRPSVDCVLVRIKKRDQSLVDNISMFRDFIVFCTTSSSFTIKKVLLKFFSFRQLIRLASNLDINLKLRPLDLKFEAWLSIYEQLLATGNRGRIVGSFNRQLAHQKKLKKIYRTRNDPLWRRKS